MLSMGIRKYPDFLKGPLKHLAEIIYASQSYGTGTYTSIQIHFASCLSSRASHFPFMLREMLLLTVNESTKH